MQHEGRLDRLGIVVEADHLDRAELHSRKRMQDTAPSGIEEADAVELSTLQKATEVGLRNVDSLLVKTRLDKLLPVPTELESLIGFVCALHWENPSQPALSFSGSSTQSSCTIAFSEIRHQRLVDHSSDRKMLTHEPLGCCPRGGPPRLIV